MENFLSVARGIDVEPMRWELEARPEFWNAHRFRTIVGVMEGVDDVLLRYTDKSVPNADPLESVNYPALQLLPSTKAFIFALAGRFAAERVGRCMYTRLKPGCEVKPHTDNHYIGNLTNYYNRYHLAIQDNPDTVFRCGDEEFRPEVGELFWFDNSKVHSVENHGTTDRITLIMDFRKPSLALFDADNNPILPGGSAPATETVKYSSKLVPGISYQRESIAQAWPELEELFPSHWAESALNKDSVPLSMDKGKYITLGAQNVMQLVTVRDGKKLIGYHFLVVGTHLHYSTTPHAISDIYHLRPEYRGKGLGTEFFETTQQILKSLGVKKWLCSHKLHSYEGVNQSHEEMFTKFGFIKSDHQYSKML